MLPCSQARFTRHHPGYLTDSTLALLRSIGSVQYLLPDAGFLCVILCDPAK